MIKTIKYIWNSISSLGITSNTSSMKARNIMLCNQLAFTWGLFVIPFYFVVINDLIASYLMIALFLVHATVLISNSLSFDKFSRFVESILPAALVYLIGAVVYKNNSIEITGYYAINLSFSIIPFLLFSFNEKKYIAISLLFSMTLFFTFDFANELLEFDKNHNLYSSTGFLYWCYFVSFSVLLVGFIYLIKINSTHFKKISMLLKASNVKNSKLEKWSLEIEKQKEELENLTSILEENNKEIDKLSVVAKKTQNGVMIFDKKGDLEWINDGYTKLFEFDFNKLKDEYGSNLKSLINAQHSNKEFSTKESFNYINKRVSKDGDKYWFQTMYTPILDNVGNIKNYIAIDSDITPIENAKKEILQQKNKIEIQRNLAVKQKEEIESQKKEITDSILYAKEIQNTILPEDKIVQDIFGKSAFILYKPKDIVSGDFYWVEKIENKILFSTIDCTGHGVPGAFMSVIGFNILNFIIYELNIHKPSEILNELNKQVEEKLKQNNSDSSNKYSMELTLCCYNIEENTLEFSSSYSPLYLKRDSEIIEYKGDKILIGSYSNSIQESFTNNRIDLRTDDTIYIGSDGFVDQFGGKRNRKFMKKNLKKVMLANENHTMAEEKDFFKSSFNYWKGDNEQTDDLVFMGVKF